MTAKALVTVMKSYLISLLNTYLIYKGIDLWKKIHYDY